MQTPRVLILEDEFFVALDLELLVHQQSPAAQVVICATVAEARRALSQGVTFGLLDVDVLDGKSFEIAAALKRANIPFVFVSGSRLDEVPPDLRQIPYVPKPFQPPHIQQVLQAVLQSGSRP